jgi:hypothetical protein
MNKPLSPAEIGQLSGPLRAPSLLGPTPPMTRSDKLLQLAELIRHSRLDFYLFHELEYYTDGQLMAAIHPRSVFALAASDGPFKDAGLKGASAANAMKFFELSQQELHEFSCDCGGGIDNEAMAKRVERLARPVSFSDRVLSRLKSAVGG